MKRMITRLLLPALVVIGLGAGAYWLYRDRTAVRAPTAGGFTQVVEVTRGNLATSISVVGELDAVQRADLGFDRMSGTAPLLGLTVKPGNSVKAGQVLATIDPAPSQQALDQAKSTLRAAEEKLAGLKTPPTRLQTAQADLAVAKAELQIQQAKAALATLQAPPDRAALQRAVDEAKDNLKLAQLQQTLAESDSLAKSERDLQYNTDWHGRRADQLKQLVIDHTANLEQMQGQVKEQDIFNALSADLARVQAQRQLTFQVLAAEVAKSEAALADAEKALASAQAGTDALALAQAQLAVQEAEVALAAAQDERAKLDLGADAVTLSAAQADLDKARLAVADAEAALAGTKLTAPFDGTILKTNAQSGDSISADTAIITLANLKLLQVVAAVDETTIRRVTAGQNAQITFDAFPGRILRGQVIEVPLQGALQGNVMVYDVPISLSGAEALPLLVGMTANVAIQLERAENVLLVPAIAIQRSGGRTQVLVPNTSDAAGSPEAVTVEVGLSDGVNTQITTGLHEGDKVVVQVTATQSNTGFPGGMGPMPAVGGSPPQGGRPPGQ